MYMCVRRACVCAPDCAIVTCTCCVVNSRLSRAAALHAAQADDQFPGGCSTWMQALVSTPVLSSHGVQRPSGQGNLPIVPPVQPVDEQLEHDALATLPRREYGRSGGHFMHDVEPTREVYMPGGQGVQDTAPVRL